MKNFDATLSLLLFLSVCLLGSGCNAGLKKSLSEKDAAIQELNKQMQELNKQINDLEKANDDCKFENRNLSQDVVKAKERIAELEKAKNDGSIPKPDASSLAYYFALAQAECEKAGSRFKHNDYLDLNEHAANALAAVTAMIALHDASGGNPAGLTNALNDAKENAEGLVAASAKREHNDSHDHHEHLESALKIIEKMAKM